MDAPPSAASSGTQRRTYSPCGSNFWAWAVGLKMRKYCSPSRQSINWGVDRVAFVGHEGNADGRRGYGIEAAARDPQKGIERLEMVEKSAASPRPAADADQAVVGAAAKLQGSPAPQTRLQEHRERLTP